MATFSVNQVRQLYVAKTCKTTAVGVVDSDTAGTIAAKKDNSNNLYFEYVGAGGRTRSDIIPISNIVSATATNASKMGHKICKDKIVLDPTINGGTPVAGQDYVLNISFRNYVGLAEDAQYFKFGMVHAVAGMTASTFYTILAKSLVMNFSREETKLIKIFIETGGTTVNAAGALVEVTKDTKLTGDAYTGIVIEENPQDWILGTFEQVPVNYTVLPLTIISNGDERIWGLTAKLPSTGVIPNGKKIADMEYFYMGERGDIYRNIGFPNVIKTSYLVDPTIEYNTIDIHYYFQGDNEGVQKSEKTITIVVPKVGGDTAGIVSTNALIKDINTIIVSPAIPALT